jgi:hypothetical protein
MPVDERLGADDCKNLKDRREPAIKLDKEPAIAVCESNTATQLAPQNNQLMSKRRILSFKPQLRLEWRGQDGKSETEQPDHFASLGDFITSSTRISFRYTQGWSLLPARSLAFDLINFVPHRRRDKTLPRSHLLLPVRTSIQSFRRRPGEEISVVALRLLNGHAETIDEGPEDTLGLDGLVQTRPGDGGIDVLMN